MNMQKSLLESVLIGVYFNCHYSGYVDEIKNILFTKEKKELQKTIDVYVKKVPESLTSQFHQQTDKKRSY